MSHAETVAASTDKCCSAAITSQMNPRGRIQANPCDEGGKNGPVVQ